MKPTVEKIKELIDYVHTPEHNSDFQLRYQRKYDFNRMSLEGVQREKLKDIK